MEIDVVLITKNSMTHSSVFERSLKSLYREVPVKRLIVVDDFSEDRTIDVLNRFPRVEIHRVNGNRAVARQYGIERVETDWFMFIDDDVILCKDWFKKASKYMEDPRVGLIWGWDKVMNPHVRNRVKVMYYLRRLDEYHLMLRNFKQRGGLHDALIRREAVKDIRIPADLHVYEDWYVKTYVEGRGYSSIAPREVWCLHYSNPSYNLENLTVIAKLQKKYGLQSDLITLRNMLLALPKCLAILVITGDRKACRDQWNMYLYNFVGRIIS